MPAAADGSVVFSTELDESGLKSGLSKLSSVGGKWAKGFGVMIGGVSTALLGLAKMGMQYNRQMENYQTNFAVLLGDEAKALDYVALMREKAAKTPFGMEDLASASQTMLSFGMSAEDSMKYMDMLGDISLGNKDKLGSLSLAFSQVSSAGKLTGQDLLQMINAGFNPLNTIAEKTGASIGDLKAVMAGDKASDEFVALLAAAEKEVETLGDNASDSAKMLAQIGREGVISADMVAQAMEIETSAGGRFYQGMLKASKTMSGMISTLKDDAMNLVGNVFAPLSAAFAENILPLASEWLSSLTAAFEEGGTYGLIDELGNVLSDILVRGSKVLPGMVNVASNILSSVVSALTRSAPSMATALASIFESLNIGFYQLVPQLADGLSAILPELGKSLAELAPNLVPVIFDGIGSAFVTLSASAPQLLDAAIAIFDGLIAGIVSSLPMIGNAALTILENLGSALVEAAPDLLASAANGIIDIINGVFGTNLPHIEDIEWPSWAEIKQGVINWWTTTKANIATIVDKVLAKFGLPPWTDLSADISAWWEATKANIISVIDEILFAFGLPSYDEMALGVSVWWASTKASIVSFLDDILFSFGLPSWAEIKASISEAWSSIKQEIGDFFTVDIIPTLSGEAWWEKPEAEDGSYEPNIWEKIFGGAFGDPKIAQEEYLEDLGIVKGNLSSVAKADVDSAIAIYENAPETVASKANRAKALLKAKLAIQEGIGSATKTAIDASDESWEYTAYGEEVAGYVADGLAMGAIELADAGRKAMLSYVQSVEGQQSLVRVAGQKTVRELVDSIEAQKPSIQAAGQKAAQGFASSIEGQQTAVQAAGQKAVQGFVSSIEGQKPSIQAAGRNTVQSFVSSVEGQQAAVQAAGREIGQAVGVSASEGVKNSVSGISSALSSALSSAYSTASARASDFKRIGEMIASGVASGINSGIDSVVSGITNLVNQALATARRKAQINSPSRLFANEVGVYIPEGVAMGVENGSYVLNNSIQKMIDDSLPDTASYGGGLGSWRRVQQLTAGSGEFNQTNYFNVPVLTPDEVAQRMYEIATFPMAGEVMP